MTTEFAEKSWYFRDALEMPALGSQLPCNFFLVRGSTRSMLIDGGAPDSRADTVAALESVIAPEELDYIFVTHGDLDHYGAVGAVLARNPNMRVLSNFEAMAKMNMFGGIPTERCAVVGPGQEIELGDRSLTVLPALLQDSSTFWLRDSKTRTLYASDGFGALLPQGTAEFAEDLTMDAFAQAFLSWQAIHFEQLPMFDRQIFADAVEQLYRPGVDTVASVHGPMIRGRTGTAMELMKQTPDFRLPGPMPVPEELMFAAMPQAA